MFIAEVWCRRRRRVPGAAGGRSLQRSEPFVTFGRVPFAFYVAHILVIRRLSMALGVWRGFDACQFVTIFFFVPAGYGVGLGLRTGSGHRSVYRIDRYCVPRSR